MCSQVARLLPEPEASRKRPTRRLGIACGTPHSRCFRAVISECAGVDDEKKPFKWWKIVPDSERPFWCMACFKSFDTEDEIFEHGTPDSSVFRGYIVCTAGWGVP